jgi:hypothetical protein
MSRKNKVNPDRYTIAGRLSPGDLARERWRQAALSGEGSKRGKPMPDGQRPFFGGAVAGAATRRQSAARAGIGGPQAALTAVPADSPQRPVAMSC